MHNALVCEHCGMADPSHYLWLASHTCIILYVKWSCKLLVGISICNTLLITIVSAMFNSYLELFPHIKRNCCVLDQCHHSFPPSKPIVTTMLSSASVSFIFEYPSCRWGHERLPVLACFIYSAAFWAFISQMTGVFKAVLYTDTAPSLSIHLLMDT